jgi:hypothetical protein
MSLTIDPVNRYSPEKSLVADMGVSGGSGLPSHQVSRVALRALGVAGIACGVAFLYLSGVGIVAGSIALASLPCALLSAGSFWASNQFYNSDVASGIERMRSQASRMSLQMVILTFGWDDLLQQGILTSEQFAQKYTQELHGKDLVQIIEFYEKTLRRISECIAPKFDYRIPTPMHSARQWRSETAPFSFKQIINKYPLDQLEKYSILEAGEAQCLKSLNREYQVCKNERNNKAGEIEREFAVNTQQYKQELDRLTTDANHRYDGNSAIRELQAFELNYARERQQIQDQLAKSKADARAHFDRSIAPFTQNGQIPYKNLPATDKAKYDPLLVALQAAEREAEKTAKEQIDQCNHRRHERLTYLNREKDRLSHERQCAIDWARRQYEREVAAHLQKKEGSLQQFDNELEAMEKTFDSRYRAYLRTIGAAR